MIGRLLLLAALTGLTFGAVADPRDQEEARRLVMSGEILPLTTLLSRLDLPAGARVIEAELEHKGDGYYYEIEYVRSDGVVEELKVDARDARVLKRKQE